MDCDDITVLVDVLNIADVLNAIVLNFARDLLVDEEAMVDALAKGKVRNMFQISLTTQLLEQRAAS